MTEIAMQCGHTANGTRDGEPVCVICVGIDPRAEVVQEERPSLDGRQAQCTCNSAPVDSDWSLPFFEFRGEGSRMATDTCGKCGYSEVAHTREPTRTTINVVLNGKCDGFTPRGAMDFDLYYCGHGGWD